MIWSAVLFSRLENQTVTPGPWMPRTILKYWQSPHRNVGYTQMHQFSGGIEIHTSFSSHQLQLTAIQRLFVVEHWAFDMLFAEMSSISYRNMADAYANLMKAERVEKAVRACEEDKGLSARKAAKIFSIAHSTITRRIRRIKKARMLISQAQQLLTPVEEQTIVKWII
jgi:helix-turn-helix, Psq domain